MRSHSDLLKLVNSVSESVEGRDFEGFLFNKAIKNALKLMLKKTLNSSK